MLDMLDMPKNFLANFTSLIGGCINPDLQKNKYYSCETRGMGIAAEKYAKMGTNKNSPPPRPTYLVDIFSEPLPNSIAASVWPNSI